MYLLLSIASAQSYIFLIAFCLLVQKKYKKGLQRYRMIKLLNFASNKKAKVFDNSMIITILMSPNKQNSTL